MRSGKRCILLFMALVWLSAAPAGAQSERKKEGGPPPAKVVVSQVREGAIAPTSTFVGTVYFVRSSAYAAEVSGRADMVSFDQGDRVEAGAVLARLNTDLLDQEIEAKKAEYQQVKAQLTNARIDLKRMRTLRKKDVVAKSKYDEVFYRTDELKSHAARVSAELERLRVQKGKTEIQASFPGVILEKSLDVGEWVSPGTPVAVLADDSLVDVKVFVPQHILSQLSPGLAVPVTINEQEHSGTLRAVVPKGDVRTRTFPVLVRLAGGKWIEGTEAKVRFPIEARQESLIVNRDAVLKLQGQDMVFTIKEGKAQPLPVTVLGYEGRNAGIRGEGLKPGMTVIIKGNERLRPGQPVAPANAKDKEGSFK